MKVHHIVLLIVAAVVAYIVYKQGGFRRLGTRETGTSTVYTDTALGIKAAPRGEG